MGHCGGSRRIQTDRRDEMNQLVLLSGKRTDGNRWEMVVIDTGETPDEELVEQYDLGSGHVDAKVDIEDDLSSWPTDRPLMSY